MSAIIPFLAANAARIVAILTIAVTYQFSRLPQLPQAERAALAAQFDFISIPMPELTGYEYRPIRTVHPDLEHIAGWFSGMGASVGLNDLDGDGLPNDACFIDIRIDQVIITPVPGTPERYEPFVLDHASLDYNAETMAPVGCLPGDMNEDGYMDLLIYYWGRTPTVFLYNPSASPKPTQESYIAQEIVPDGGLWNSSAATFADLDGDGHVDLIVSNYYQDDRAILDRNSDQVIEMQHSFSRAYNGGANYIFLWESATAGPTPSVQFKEVEWTADSDMIHAWTLAVGAADLDGDLLPEIYFANDFGEDRLLHNQSTPGELRFAQLEGERTFMTPRSKVLGQDSFKGMGIDFADINNDGFFDMYVSNIAADYALHESHFLFVSTDENERISEGIAPY
ncbi:VCBS repeat-containing protein, partial [Chloroflexi bacterium TSY]|nr:VCBS repeat-containing protein [Chloroflexi bacterium TSY]